MEGEPCKDFYVQKVCGLNLQVAPIQYAPRRHDTYRLLNPVPYRARYFGVKLHLDQDEKCVTFGVTHVVAIDGYSRKIVGFITIPKKNSIVIYDLLFRPLLLLYGMWAQVRVDHGTEFALIITAQQHLAQHHQQNQSCHPVLQSLSRQNHRAERVWPEINNYINYPVKRVLIEMESAEEINMGDEVTKFCVSWVTIHVMHNATQVIIRAWNCHRIPGTVGGVPNTLALENNHVSRLPSTYIPSTHELVQVHEQSGACLSRDVFYGYDPLTNSPHLQELRQRDFFTAFPDLNIVFHNILHGDAQLFKYSIHHFIWLTNSFAACLEKNTHFSNPPFLLPHSSPLYIYMSCHLSFATHVVEATSKY